MRNFYIITILIFFTKMVLAQSASKLFEKANEEFLIGNYTNAIKHCKLSIKKDSSVKEVNYIIGLAYYNLKDSTNAIHFFNREIKINKSDYRSYLYKAKLTIKNYNSANNELSKAINTNSANFLLYLEKGNLNYYHHKYAEAIKNYETAISLKPNLSDAFYNLAFCKLNLTDTLNACKYWDKVEELDDYKDYELIQKICTKYK